MTREGVPLILKYVGLGECGDSVTVCPRRMQMQNTRIRTMAHLTALPAIRCTVDYWVAERRCRRSLKLIPLPTVGAVDDATAGRCIVNDCAHLRQGASAQASASCTVRYEMQLGIQLDSVPAGHCDCISCTMMDRLSRILTAATRTLNTLFCPTLRHCTYDCAVQTIQPVLTSIWEAYVEHLQYKPFHHQCIRNLMHLVNHPSLCIEAIRFDVIDLDA